MGDGDWRIHERGKALKSYYTWTNYGPNYDNTLDLYGKNNEREYFGLLPF